MKQGGLMETFGTLKDFHHPMGSLQTCHALSGTFSSEKFRQTTFRSDTFRPETCHPKQFRLGHFSQDDFDQERFTQEDFVPEKLNQVSLYSILELLLK